MKSIIVVCLLLVASLSFADECHLYQETRNAYPYVVITQLDALEWIDAEHLKAYTPVGWFTTSIPDRAKLMAQALLQKKVAFMVSEPYKWTMIFVFR